MILSVEKGKTVGERLLLKCLVAQADKHKLANSGPIYMHQGAEAAQRNGEQYAKDC